MKVDCSDRVNVLIIGNGAREYSLAMSFRRDPRVNEIYFSPEHAAASVFLSAGSLYYTSYDHLLSQIRELGIGLVVIGPELPIAQGMSDFLDSSHVPVFAPSLSNSALESSKSYTKDLARRLNMPTARYVRVESASEGYAFIDSLHGPIVLKADGLCGGKGVLIVDSKDRAKEELSCMLSGSMFGNAGRSVVIEEYLDGYELSVFVISNGSDFALLPACQDHKRLLDGDMGVNTGGMGAYTNLPSHLYDKSLETKIVTSIIRPTLDDLALSGRHYRGVLFAGIMVCGGDPYLLEYNVRFGDPECEVMIPSMRTPLLDVMLAAVRGGSMHLEFDDYSYVGVVAASSDYAQSYKSDSYPARIELIDFDPAIGHISFANVSRRGSDLYANSGRVAVCVGRGTCVREARDNAYKIMECIHFEGKYFRRDIASRAVL